MGTRDTILNADDTIYETVEVPEWGVTVAVKGLTIAEQQRFMRTVRKRTGRESDYQVDRDKFQIQLIIATVVDVDTHKSVFEAADANALNAKSAKAASRLYEVASRLSGFSDDDDAEAELKPTASDDSF